MLNKVKRLEKMIRELGLEYVVFDYGLKGVDNRTVYFSNTGNVSIVTGTNTIDTVESMTFEVWARGFDSTFSCYKERT